MSARALATLTCALAVTGCGPAAYRSAPTIARDPSSAIPDAPTSDREVRRVAAEFIRAYLRLEVGHPRPADRALIRGLADPNVARQAIEAPRPTNHGYPPAGQLMNERLLPQLEASRWTVQALVRRGRRREWWELDLTTSTGGPVLTSFTSTAPGDTP